MLKRALGVLVCLSLCTSAYAQTLGTIFYDIDNGQPGGSGVFFRTMPTAYLKPSP